jgi:hypothetical protein
MKADMKEIVNLEFTQEADQYKVTIEHGGQVTALLSPKGDLKDKNIRRMALTALFIVLSDTIRGRLFPADTRVYDVIDTPGGKKAINSHYPNEKS